MQVFPLSVQLDEFENRLTEVLRNQPDGCSEYELIQILRNEDLFTIDENELLSSDSLIMFRIHFTVYHSLYRLRDRLRQNRESELELSPVSIQLRKFKEGDDALVEYDPLYDYYMDINNLKETGSSDVDEMLSRFWSRLDNSERRVEALKELDLADPVRDEDIRKQYRRMAMKHHPDRGGDTSKLQRINAAFAVLLNSYNLD